MNTREPPVNESHWVTTTDDEKRVRISYTTLCLLDQGSFGKVFKIRIDEFRSRKIKNRENLGTVMAQKVLLPPSNRELKLLKLVDHTNVIKLQFYRREARTLRLFFPLCHTSLYEILERKTLTESESETVINQLFRALSYLHDELRICHRDVKPKNVLLADKDETRVKLCDFGSARIITTDDDGGGGGDELSSYVCSRFYRAPELLLGSKRYTHQIDIWSVACVWAETLIGRPLFYGETSVDQLVEIIVVLGVPTSKQLDRMNAQTELIPVLNLISDDRVSSSDFKTRLSRKMESFSISDRFSRVMETLLTYENRPSASSILRLEF